jgi:hypothetical protein
MLLAKLERGVRALERIAEALERYNRAALFPINFERTLIYEGQPSEVLHVRLEEPVNIEVSGEIVAHRGDS